MEKYLLIGNPVSHSISPLIHNEFFKLSVCTKKHYAKLKIDPLNQNVVDAFIQNDIKGINVTTPYKRDIIKYLYAVDDAVQIIGSANTLKLSKNGYIGHNTDIDGIERTFSTQEITVKDKNVLILGAGGSSYTATYFALKNNAHKVYIANRTTQNAQSLKKHFIIHKFETDIITLSLEDIKILTDVDIIINTTTVGFSALVGQSIIEEPFFHNNTLSFVFDIIYIPTETRLLSLAKKFNIPYQNGFNMLIHQAIKGQEIWQNVKISKSTSNNLINTIHKKMFIRNQ